MSLTPETTKLEELRGKLYLKAKTEPTFRFYALYDKVYRWDVLTEALRLSREKNGAPGVDGQTFDQIREYGEERWLQELQQELQEKTYRPQPVRRVLIPKPGGGERPLGIPTIKDRVAQTAAKLILEPIFEADLSDTAYGYRPGRGAVRAVQQVHQELAPTPHQGRRCGSLEVLRHDSPRGADDLPRAEDRRCGDAASHQDVAEGAGRGERRARTAAVQRRQALQVRDAAGRCDFAAVGEHLHQPDAQSLRQERPDETVRGAGSSTTPTTSWCCVNTARRQSWRR